MLDRVTSLSKVLYYECGLQDNAHNHGFYHQDYGIWIAAPNFSCIYVVMFVLKQQYAYIILDISLPLRLLNKCIIDGLSGILFLLSPVLCHSEYFIVIKTSRSVIYSCYNCVDELQRTMKFSSWNKWFISFIPLGISCSHVVFVVYFWSCSVPYWCSGMHKIVTF